MRVPASFFSTPEPGGHLSIVSTGGGRGLQKVERLD